MALTNDDSLAQHMSMLRSHGITRDPHRLRSSGQTTTNSSVSYDAPPAWYYEQQMLGFNYRMTDIEAALGVSQLERLSDYVERRNGLARRYDRALKALPLQLPTVQAENCSAFHLYVVRLKHGDLVKSHRQIFDELRKLGIGVNVHYTPVHLQPHYRELGFSPLQYPESEAYGESAVTLPLYPTLTHPQQDEVVRALEEVL